VNEAIRNIYLRRAVRDYLPADVPDDIVRELIKAGTYAPSAMNKQPWRFIVVKGRDTISRLSERSKKLWLDTVGRNNDPALSRIADTMRSPGFNIFYNAPVLVLIFATADAMRPSANAPWPQRT